MLHALIQRPGIARGKNMGLIFTARPFYTSIFYHVYAERNVKGYFNARANDLSVTLHGMSLLETVRMMYRYTTTYGRRSGRNIKLTPALAEQMLTDAGFEGVRTRLLGDEVKVVVGEGLRPGAVAD